MDMMKRILALYFNSWWLPALVYIFCLGGFTISELLRWHTMVTVTNVLFCITGIAFLGIITASIWNFIKKRWNKGIINTLLIFGCGMATVFALGFLVFASMFGPSEDGFADDLTIPEGIEIAEPDPDTTDPMGANCPKGSDEFQDTIRKALTVPGNDIIQFVPAIPSLRKASTEHPKMFRDYIEASPDWHVFMEQGNRFASRRWSYGGEPRDELHGYISEFGDKSGFQTRCLLCLDCKPWSRYSVQHVQEGSKQVEPLMSMGNRLHESRVMIECGGVWVEIFEQSGNPERRITKATVMALEKEFAKFLKNPEDAVSTSRKLASRLTDKDKHPFRLITGMQPGNLCCRLLP